MKEKHTKLNPDCEICDEEGYIEELSCMTAKIIKVPHLCMPTFESEWEKGFEDEIYWDFRELCFKNPKMIDDVQGLVAESLNVDKKSVKVRVKYRKGAILIERIEK